MSNTIIYHNPDCGTSRNTLAMIRNSGMEPTIIYYLDTPPSREELVGLIAAMGITVRALLRKNVEPYAQLGLDDETLSDERLIESMLQHPILINRPIVVTPLGTRLCRPSEVVLEILTPRRRNSRFARRMGNGSRRLQTSGCHKASGSVNPASTCAKKRLACSPSTKAWLNLPATGMTPFFSLPQVSAGTAAPV